MKGDPREQFDELWAQHAAAVYGYAARRVGLDGADEIVSEVFAVVWRRLDDVPADPLPWLYGVGRNVIRQYHRASFRRRRLEEALVSTTPTSIEFDGSADVLDAFFKLDDTDQEILRLVAWEELTPKEAAQVIGIAPPAFRMRLTRARRRLRVLLGEEVTRRDY